MPHAVLAADALCVSCNTAIRVHGIVIAVVAVSPNSDTPAGLPPVIVVVDDQSGTMLLYPNAAATCVYVRPGDVVVAAGIIQPLVNPALRRAARRALRHVLPGISHTTRRAIATRAVYCAAIAILPDPIDEPRIAIEFVAETVARATTNTYPTTSVALMNVGFPTRIHQHTKEPPATLDPLHTAFVASIRSSTPIG